MMHCYPSLALGCIHVLSPLSGNHNCSRRYFDFFFKENISLDISCESSKQTIYMKCQDLYSLKTKNKLECRQLQILLDALRVKLKEMSHLKQTHFCFSILLL